MTSDQKTVLIVGVGSIGERHLRCFQATGRARLSVCEIDAELRQRIAEQYKVGQTYADLKAAMAETYDAAVIAVPAPLHVPMAIELGKGGTHLLIEKPLSTSLEGIDSLVRMVRNRGITAMVAYVLRANPALIAMKEAIDARRFGPPVHLVVNSGQHFPTYRPAYREIYYRDRATGGGAIQDALTHMIDVAQWLIGPVDCVVADAVHQVLEGVDVEDTVNVLARHGSVPACYSLNQHQAPNEATITVVCASGTCRYELHTHRWRWMTEPGTQWHDEDFGPLERDSLFVDQANAFLDAIEGKREPLCTLDEGIRTLRANLAILASAEQQAWQAIDHSKL